MEGGVYDMKMYYCVNVSGLPAGLTTQQVEKKLQGKPVIFQTFSLCQLLNMVPFQLNFTEIGNEESASRNHLLQFGNVIV